MTDLSKSDIRQYNERLSIAYILAHPNEIDQIIDYKNMFIYELHRDIIQLIKNYDLHTSISENDLYKHMNMFSEDPLSLDITEIYTLISARNITHKSLRESLKRIKADYNTDQLINQALKGVKLLREGNIKKAITTLKGVRYNSQIELSHTATLMEMAVLNNSSFKTGLWAIDSQQGGLEKRNLMTIAGDSGTMKTMASLWICLMILKENPEYKCLYFEKEMHEYDIGKRLVQMLLEKTNKEIMELGVLDYMSTEWKNKAKVLKTEIKDKCDLDGKLANAIKRLHIVPNNSFNTADDIYELVETHKPDIWCLDFITMLSGKNGNGNKFDNVSEQIEQLKNMVTDTNTFGIILSQLSMHKAQTRHNKIPMTDDFEYGGKLKQYSSYIYSTFFPKLYYPKGLTCSDIGMQEWYFYLIGLKTRSDKSGNILLRARPEFCTFDEVDGSDFTNMKKWLYGYNTA